MINIILYGGNVTRLWTISRTLMPKQFVKLFNDKSLFQLTVERNKNVDLANAHVKAIKYLEQDDTKHNPLIVNIGTGIGYSVLDMVQAFEIASKRKIPYKIVKRREGDIAECYADPSFAKEVLGFKAEKTIEEMCEDSWRWQSNNFDGYK